MSDMSDVVTEIRRLKDVEQNWKSVTGCFSAFGKLLVLVSVIWWRPFSVMLALGMTHSYFPEVPALGFWGSWLLVIAVGVLTRKPDLSALTGKKAAQTTK